jgi:hypothetical protein
LRGGTYPPRSAAAVAAVLRFGCELPSREVSPAPPGDPDRGDFADKPLIVLTAGSGHDAAWSAAQNRMATLSTNSVHRVIAGAIHEDLSANEEDAAATTQAILDVVSSVRSQRRLVK